MSPKVLMIGWELPPFNSGGLGEACLGLAKALSRKGAKIYFVLPQKQDFNYDFMDLIYANVNSEDINMINSVYTTLEIWLKGKKFTIKDVPSDYIAGALKYSQLIAEIAHKVMPDVIHSHDWLTFPAGMVAKQVTSKPLVSHVHSTEYDRTGGNLSNRIVYDIEKSGMETADKVIAISKLQRDIISEKYFIDRGKIDVVYNGASFFNNSKLDNTLTTYKSMGYKIILFLGRITLQKGPEYFVRAAKKVLEYESKALFVVTGSGDMFSQMVNEAASLGILNNFIFTGFIQGEDKNRIYQSADIYVMPSVSEPFGLTVLEAIGNNTPVLVSKQSGVSEIVSHALKCDFWDTDELANKIISSIRFPALLEVLCDESKKELPNINWDKSADKCLRIYDSLMT